MSAFHVQSVIIIAAAAIALAHAIRMRLVHPGTDRKTLAAQSTLLLVSLIPSVMSTFVLGILDTPPTWALYAALGTLILPASIITWAIVTKQPLARYRS